MVQDFRINEKTNDRWWILLLLLERWLSSVLLNFQIEWDCDKQQHSNSVFPSRCFISNVCVEQDDTIRKAVTSFVVFRIQFQVNYLSSCWWIIPYVSLTSPFLFERLKSIRMRKAYSWSMTSKRASISRIVSSLDECNHQASPSISLIMNSPSKVKINHLENSSR